MGIFLIIVLIKKCRTFQCGQFRYLFIPFWWDDHRIGNIILIDGGKTSSSLEDLDLHSVKVLCVGFSSDILYSAEKYPLT